MNIWKEIVVKLLAVGIITLSLVSIIGRYCTMPAIGGGDGGMRYPTALCFLAVGICLLIMRYSKNGKVPIGWIVGPSLVLGIMAAAASDVPCEIQRLCDLDRWIDVLSGLR